MNGGFHQYFHNSSGDLAPLAVQGLKAIGAENTVQILERALAIFPPGAYSTERELRWKGLDAISTDPAKAIAAFDKVPDALQDYPEDVEGLALDRLTVLYVSKGVDSLRLPRNGEDRVR